MGRPITDLTSDLRCPTLANDVRDVLQTLAPTERSVTALDERWFSVRIMPCRTLDDRIHGAVITFTDITAAKTLEAKLRAKQAGFRGAPVKPFDIGKLREVVSRVMGS